MLYNEPASSLPMILLLTVPGITHLLLLCSEADCWSLGFNPRLKFNCFPPRNNPRQRWHTVEKQPARSIHYLKVECFICFSTGLSKEYALSNVSHSHCSSRSFFGPMRMKKPFNCEAKKRCLSEWSKDEIIGFRTTVLFKALFTLIIYYFIPLTTEGYWCFFLVLCNFCQYIFFGCVFLHFMLQRQEEST